MDCVECVVVGAGVVGLAIARRLAGSGREVLLLEAAETIGTGISSRNSEVIHAGLYYTPGSLKAQLSRTGRDALYRFCVEHGVAHRRLGKLLLATENEQHGRLAAIKAVAERNAVDDLVPLSAEAVRDIEPELHCTAALLSPSTGIIDTHGFMLALQGDAERRGALVAFRTPVLKGTIRQNGIVLCIGGDEPMELLARMVVNAAGLDAAALAGKLEGFPKHHVPQTFYAKGNYFGVRGATPSFQRLIYPLPDAAGLGIHATLDLAGRIRFGPDVEWTDRRDYEVRAERAGGFYEAIRRYWPGLPDGVLVPDYAGIRPKLVREGQDAADFLLQGPNVHGQPGLFNLFGIESPGITASLAIADVVAGAYTG